MLNPADGGRMKFLITGGAGYLGSHLTLELISNNHGVVVFDNFSGNVVSKNLQGSITVEGSINKTADLEEISKLGPFDGIFHVAAKKSVSESILFPSKYIETNVLGSENVLNFSLKNNIKNVVFTSSAAVYGAPDIQIIDEKEKINPLNTYGETKMLTERLLERASREKLISAFSLRTFNMGGAIANAYYDKMGENVVPKILSSLFTGSRFQIYGNNYSTSDGTCVRDYIHVTDVAKAHVAAMEHLICRPTGTYYAINISSNLGTSVEELIKKIEKISGRKLNYDITERRSGDPAHSIGSNEFAKKLLVWEPTSSLDQILFESLRAYAY
jgi:UDP-glucose 4-epimerase